MEIKRGNLNKTVDVTDRSITNSIEALRKTLSELKDSPRRAEALTSRRPSTRGEVSQVRLRQIRNQEVVRQLDLNSRRLNQSRRSQSNLNSAPKFKQAVLNQVDPEAEDFAKYLAEQQSLEGLSLEEAVQLRLKNLEENYQRVPAVEDPIIQFSEIGFSDELRFAQLTIMLETSPMLVFVSPQIRELLKQDPNSNFDWLLAFWRELKKRRSKAKFFTEEDMLEVLVAQFYPILLAAITKVLGRGVDEDTIATEMASLNGELVNLMREAAREDHPAYYMLQQVKNWTQNIGLVEWNDTDLI